MFIKNFKKTNCINGCKLFNDSSNYTYWESRGVTNDEIEIVHFLNKKHIQKKISILHIGIGNSYVAYNLNIFKNLDGITISNNEIKYAQKLNINNYSYFFFNKLEKNVFNNIEFSSYDAIIDVNLKSFSCCDIAFKKLFVDYSKMLKINGIILTGKKGMSWTRLVKPVIRFSLTKFFYKRLKEFDGPISNVLTIDECKNLAKENNLEFEEINNTNIVTFTKY